MYRIYPDDCVRLAKVNSINDLKVSHLKQIAELERPFASRYYNDDSKRSIKEREDDVVNGKFGELFIMIFLAKAGAKITTGVLFTEETDPKIYGDGGVDLAANKKDIQVKYCSGRYLNFKTERQEDAVRENLKNNVIVLICQRGIKGYKIRHLTQHIFMTERETSTKYDCKSYICCDKIKTI